MHVRPGHFQGGLTVMVKMRDYCAEALVSAKDHV